MQKSSNHYTPKTLFNISFPVFFALLKFQMVLTLSWLITMPCVNIMRPRYVMVVLWNLPYSGFKYNPAFRKHCKIHMTCSTCSSSGLLYTRMSSRYADTKTSSGSMITLFMYPWKSAIACVIPKCMTVDSNRPFLEWRANVCSSHFLTYRRWNIPWISSFV